LEQLQAREQEVNARTMRTKDEKNNIESFTSNYNDKLMQDELMIKQRVQTIKEKLERKRQQKMNSEQTALNMLFDIESKVEAYMRFFEICKKLDENSVRNITSEIKVKIAVRKKLNFRKLEEEKADREKKAKEANAKIERKVYGIKRPMGRHSKKVI